MRKNLFNRLLTQNSILLGASNVAGVLLNFGISILIGRGLGLADFGRWAFLIAWASAGTMICEFGMNTLLTRRISNSPDSLNQLLFSTLLIKFLLVTLTGLIIWTASPHLGLDAETSQGLRYVVFIVLFGVMYGSFTATFRALGLMLPILVINISSLSFQLLGIFLLLERSNRVLYLIQWLTFTTLFQLSLAAIYWILHLGRMGGKVKITISSCISILKTSIPFAIAAVVGAIQMRSSVILLGYIKNVDTAGVFGSASRFTEAAKLIPNGIFDAAFPALAKDVYNFETRQLLFRQLNQVILLYCLLTVLPLIFLSANIIGLIFGQAFLVASPVLIWLGISLFPTLNNAVVEVYLYATGDEKFAARLGLVGLAVQVVSGLPLMHFYGATGAAIGVLLGETAIWLPLKLRLRKLTH